MIERLLTAAATPATIAGDPLPIHKTQYDSRMSRMADLPDR
jgi:hypothetical protein